MISNKMVKLSVVIPCFNEQNTLEECVSKLRDIADENLSLEIIIVDDCSTDNSYNLSEKLACEFSEIKTIRHEKNQGKGAALRTGFNYVTGDFVAIQDADLEYDPRDLKKLLTPLIDGKADVVIGSRFLPLGPHRVLYFWHSVGNKLITFLSNMLTDLNLTDIESGYKVFRRSVIQQIQIEENKFGFEPEIIAKVAHMNLRIYEMGISYFGRTYEEGKKIGYKDGFWAIYCIFKYNIFKSPAPIQVIVYFLFMLLALFLNTNICPFLTNKEVIPEIASTISFSLIALLGFPILGGGKINYKTDTKFYIYLLCLLCGSDLVLNNTFANYIFAEPLNSKFYSLLGVLILNFFIIRFWLVKPFKHGPHTKEVFQ